MGEGESSSRSEMRGFKFGFLPLEETVGRTMQRANSVAAEGFTAHSYLRIENGEMVRRGIQSAQLTDCGCEAKTDSPA